MNNLKTVEQLKEVVQMLDEALTRYVLSIQPGISAEQLQDIQSAFIATRIEMEKTRERISVIQSI